MARVAMTDPQLAALAETTKQQIHKLRHGQRKLTVQWAKRLAPHLDSTWQERRDSRCGEKAGKIPASLTLRTRAPERRSHRLS